VAVAGTTTPTTAAPLTATTTMRGTGTTTTASASLWPQLKGQKQDSYTIEQAIFPSRKGKYDR